MLSRSYRRKIFKIDSTDRTSGSVSNFGITLDMPARNNWNTMSLLIAEIDKSYWMLDSSTTNSFTVTTNGTPAVLTLSSDCVYSAEQLREELEDKLQAIDADYSVVFNSGVANYSTGKYTITNTTFDFDFNLSSAPVIAQYLGFSAGIHLASGAGPYILVSTTQINLQRYQSLTISSSLAINNDTSILAYVFPNSYSSGSVISYTNTFTNFFGSVAAGDTQSNYLTFTLTGKDAGSTREKEVNLNGGNWRLVVTLSEEGL